MLDLLGMVAALRRPRLLVAAARFAAARHDHSRCVLRHLAAPQNLRSGEAILHLLEAEAEGKRRLGDARYSALRHIEVLAALLGESRLLRESLRPRLVVA